MSPWMLLVKSGWFTQVTEYLTTVGATKIRRMDEYLLCEGPDDLPETVRDCESVVQIVRITPDQAAALETVHEEVTPEMEPLAPGALVTVTVTPDCQMTGRLHALAGDQATVHVLCFGRAVPMTVNRTQVGRVELSDAWS